MSESRCFTEKAPQDGGPPLFQHGNIVFQAHHVGWIITCFFTIIATVTSFWLVGRHLKWYTNKREQRYIVRLLFMVPIYATISFASYLFWDHHTPLLLLRDCYESTVLTAFFYLLLTYLSPDPDEQRAIFLKVGLSRQVDREARRLGHAETKWMFPLCMLKWKPEDGLYFLQIMKWGVLQYCVVRPLTTLAAVTLDYVGLYCEKSWALKWGHPYITVIVSISVSVAMYCLVQLYMPVATHLARHKPLLKLFAVKAVVFLTFWQATLLGLLGVFRVVKDTPYMTADAINIGFGAILETFEMTLFAFLHIKAFSYKPYRHPPGPNTPRRMSRLRALGHAMDFRETFREIWLGIVYISDRARGREPKPDKGARRTAYLEHALGKGRPSAFLEASHPKAGNHTNQDVKRSHRKPIEVQIEEYVDVEVGGERQWLGIGDDYAYGLGFARRERSEGLGVQITKELQRRGLESNPLDTEIIGDHKDNAEGHKRHTTWWRNIYDRISQSGSEHSGANLTAIPSKRRFRSRHSSTNLDRRGLLSRPDYDEPPPPSALRVHRNELRETSDHDERFQQHRRNRTSQNNFAAEEHHLYSTSALATPSATKAFCPESHSTTTLEQQPLSPLLTRIGEGFAQSVTDHGVLSEPEATSPSYSNSVSLGDVGFSQPPASMPFITTQSHFHESEFGELHSVSHKSHNPTEVRVAPGHSPNSDSDIPPPVPPKSPDQDAGKLTSERGSHHRESAQYHLPETPLSPLILPFSPSDPAFAPNPRPRPPRSTRPNSNSTPTSPGTSVGTPGSTGPAQHDPNSDGSSQQLEPISPVSIQPTRQPTSIPRGVQNMPTRRSRHHSLPMPAAYSVPNRPLHTYQHHRAPHHRMSTPLERIPQDSVPANLSSQNRVRYQAAYTVDPSHSTHWTRYPEYIEPNRRRPRHLHAPRVPVMPQLLARNPQDTPRVELDHFGGNDPVST